MRLDVTSSLAVAVESPVDLKEGVLEADDTVTFSCIQGSAGFELRGP